MLKVILVLSVLVVAIVGIMLITGQISEYNPPGRGFWTPHTTHYR
jgi:hypothetical protein